MPKLLALVSNPDNAFKLRGDREVKEVINCIRAHVPIGFEYEIANQIRSDELPAILKRNNPQLIHFTGHGNEEAQLLFENINGQKTAISNSVIDIIFKTSGKNIKCVLFSACYSSVQAKIISKHALYAIGFPGVIEEELASFFSRSFYESLATGMSVKEAFELSKSLIESLIDDKKRLPELHKNDSAKNLVVFETPRLFAKFKKEVGTVKLNKGGNFDFILSVDKIPHGVTSITYEIIEDDYPEEEKCTHVTNLASGNSIVKESYGDLVFHVWLWSESKEVGFGFKTTLMTALKNHYGENPPDNIIKAIKKMHENDEN